MTRQAGLIVTDVYGVSLPYGAAEEPFRVAARHCLALDLKPETIAFIADGAPSLLPPLPETALNGKRIVRVSRSFAEQSAATLCHRASDRYDLLYALLWRIAHGEPDVMAHASDPFVARVLDYARAVRRDVHKMHAFLRFRERTIEERTVSVAWFEPQHHSLRRALPFFTERFASMDWVITTPDETAIWQDRRLTFAEGAPRPLHENDAVLDEVWLTYFRTIFNPARLHVNAMLREMPKRYWRDMPETKLIPTLLREAAPRAGDMAARPADVAPRFAVRIAERREEKHEMANLLDRLETKTLATVRRDAASCTRCPLYEHATQTVFGEGPSDATVMFVGEQPGDQEDIAGKPFVGPAGQLFDRALGEAGIDRARVYITNAVKHFKFEPRGKRRIHQKPNNAEVKVCRWWLDQEIALVQPQLIVALGATAAYALAGRAVPIMKERGRMTTFGEQRGLITVHPSFLLRLPDAESAVREFASFVNDLKQVAHELDAADQAA